MSSPILWVAIAGAFGVGEMLTAGGFFLAPFAVAAATAGSVVVSAPDTNSPRGMSSLRRGADVRFPR